MSFWNPKLPGLRRLSGTDYNVRDLADKMIQAKYLKLQQELEAPSEREKFEWTQLMNLKSQELEKSKFLVNKAMEQYNRLESPTEKRMLLHQLDDLMSGFDPAISQFITGMLAATPFGNQQRKALDYRSVNPAIQVTANYEQDPNGWLNQSFSRERDRAKFERFMGDTEAKENPFVEAPDGTFYYKNPDTQIITHIGEKEKEILSNLSALKAANMSIEQAKANGGMVPLKDFTDLTDGQNQYMVRPVRNIFTNAVSIQKLPTGKATTEAPFVMPEEGTKILSYMRFDEDELEEVTDPIARSVLDYKKKRQKIKVSEKITPEQKKELNDLLKSTLQPHLPGINIAIKKPQKDIEKDWFLKEYDENTDEYLVFWPGVQTSFPGRLPNINIPVWYDSNTGIYWYGPTPLGSEEQAMAWAATQPPKEKK